jgi:hypothetical protein
MSFLINSLRLIDPCPLNDVQTPHDAARGRILGLPWTQVITSPSAPRPNSYSDLDFFLDSTIEPPIGKLKFTCPLTGVSPIDHFYFYFYLLFSLSLFLLSECKYHSRLFAVI